MSSEKKRKATLQENGRPSKKQQLAGSVKVNHVQGSDTVKPVVGELTLTDIETCAYTDGYKLLLQALCSLKA